MTGIDDGWLSVELDPINGSVELHGNPAGLKRLIARIEALLARNPGEAELTELFSPVRGGDDLLPDENGQGNQPIHRLLLLRWPD